MNPRHALRLGTTVGLLLAVAATVVMTAACVGPDGAPVRTTTTTPPNRIEVAGPVDRIAPAAFVRLGNKDESDVEQRVEVTDLAALDRYLAQLPAGLAADARAQLASHPRATGDRLFAFRFTGCEETGATLTIRASGVGADRLTARLTGGEGILCYAPNYFLAIFAVPDSLLR